MPGANAGTHNPVVGRIGKTPTLLELNFRGD